MVQSNAKSQSPGNFMALALKRKQQKQAILDTKIQQEIMRTSILNLARNREYDQILFVLTKNDVDISQWLDIGPRRNTKSYTWMRRRNKYKHQDEMNHFKGKTVLHLIVRDHPPVDVIDLIILRMTAYHEQWDAYYAPEIESDILEKTPLHYATQHGCSFNVIERLLSGKMSTQPAFMQDSMSRFPLHWACTNRKQVQVAESESSTPCLPRAFLRGRHLCTTNVSLDDDDDDDFCKAIILLANINPDAVNCRDQNGLTPIELAKEFGISDRIIWFLEGKRSETTHNKSLGGSSGSSVTKEITVSDYSRLQKIHVRVIPEAVENDENLCLPAIPMEIHPVSEIGDERDDLSSVGLAGTSTYNRPSKQINVRGKQIWRELVTV